MRLAIKGEYVGRRLSLRAWGMDGKRSRALGCVFLLVALLAGGLLEDAGAQAKPEGEMRWALYVTLAPVWFDPGEVTGLITPCGVLYAIHDAVVKAMPGYQAGLKKRPVCTSTVCEPF